MIISHSRSDDSICYRQTTIKRELSNLCSWQLSKGISKLNNRRIVILCECSCPNAVVACFLHCIVDCPRIFEMNSLVTNSVLRDLRRIGTKYKLANICTIAKFVVDILLIANVDFLKQSQWCLRFCERSKYLSGIIRWPHTDKFFVFPFIYYQTNNWIPRRIIRHLDKLREYERFDVASPGFPAVHSCASLSILIFLVLISASVMMRLYQRSAISTNCTSIALTVNIDRINREKVLRHPGIFAVAL